MTTRVKITYRATDFTTGKRSTIQPPPGFPSELEVDHDPHKLDAVFKVLFFDHMRREGLELPHGVTHEYR
jgi:hypothetical protein